MESKEIHVSISNGNRKMGEIKSVSLPAGITCRADCLCIKKCYARKIERLYKTTRESYARNLKILSEEPDKYWREVEASIMMSLFFRFHVSGDIPNYTYFKHMVDVSERNRHCQILCFTKKYDIVNSYLRSGGRIPDNLHVIFSGWTGLEMDNPFNLPEAHVHYRDGTSTARQDAKKCTGNCTECARTSSACWSLKSGEQVVFNEH